MYVTNTSTNTNPEENPQKQERAVQTYLNISKYQILLPNQYLLPSIDRDFKPKIFFFLLVCFALLAFFLPYFFFGSSSFLFFTSKLTLYYFLTYGFCAQVLSVYIVFYSVAFGFVFAS